MAAVAASGSSHSKNLHLMLLLLEQVQKAWPMLWVVLLIFIRLGAGTVHLQNMGKRLGLKWVLYICKVAWPVYQHGGPAADRTVPLSSSQAKNSHEEFEQTQ
jgi:hypothetical protein